MKGRPASPDATSAILEATRSLLAEGGVRGLTVEGVAARSGVAKTTIYRRWRSKKELALLVLIDMVDRQARSVRDRGDTRAELVDFVHEAGTTLDTTLMGRVMQGLMSDLPADPAFAKAFRERVIGLRDAELTRVLRRGIERGDIRPDADLGIASELLFGPVYYRLLLAGKRHDRAFAESVVAAYMASAGSRVRATPGATG